VSRRQSAGILVYRRRGTEVEVLLGHPGGPFWAKKDAGAWSIPKGEIAEGEDVFEAAKREFTEETGHPAPRGSYLELGSCKNSSGKQIFAWAVEGDLDTATIESNKTTIEWPPKSGTHIEIPEIDRARWVLAADAPKKLHKGQDIFVRRLLEALGIALREPPEQQSLL
jgi:predicted NUDIX family NTP pyrophosphohydrolase